tara:strand:+ start:2268 stop:2447 length:180 start_codon:yes stop_codon:yes gene_type:complete
MDAPPTDTDIRYTAHTVKTEDGDWALVISLRGLADEAEAMDALESIMGRYVFWPSTELH